MKEISIPKKGMIKDLDDLNLSNDSYTHALNALLENSTGDGFLLQNDYSNIFGEKLSGKVLGKLAIPELNRTLLFTDNNQILEATLKRFNDNKFNAFSSLEGSSPVTPSNTAPVLNIDVLISSSCFNWNINNKLSIQYKITDSTLNIYFVDGKNEDRYLYFNINNNTLSVEESFYEVIGYDVYGSPIYGENIDCNSLKWYPEVTYPQITVDDTEGGNLLAGTYSILAAYSTSKGIALSKYKGATNPFPLFTKSLTDITNYNTGKALKIKVENLDKIGRYKYINLAVVEFINEVISYKFIGTFPINNIVEHTYTGDGKAIILDEQSVFQIYPFYKSSKGLAKANNKLFKYGVKEYEKFNLQPLADKFKFKWFTITAQEGDYANPNFAQSYRSLIRDEVYTFGIKFILDNGEETPVVVGIGREKNANDLIVVDKNNLDASKVKDECNPDEDLPYWKVYNTATVTKTNSTVLDKCDYNQYQEGDFAYVESTDKYPNDPNVWGELANTPIRHFKTPDCLVSPIQNGVSTFKVGYDQKNFIYPLGIKLDDSVNVNAILQEAVNLELITQNQKDRIRGYKIVRGNRVGNKSVIAKGWTSDMWSYNEKNTPTFYPNHGFNDLRPDSYISSQDLKTFSPEERNDFKNSFNPSSRYTFHSPDTSFTQPTIGNILKVENEIFGDSKGFFSKSRGQGEYVILSQRHYNFAIIIAWLLTVKLKLSEASAGAGSQGQAIGGAVGAVAGGVIGSFAAGVGAPLGAALGSALGSTIGKLVGGSTTNDDYNDMYRLSMWISQTDRILELLNNTIPMQNYHWQYQAVGKYNNTEKVENTGAKQRRILNSAYLNGTRQLVDVPINNNDREQSVYLHLDNNIGFTKNQDRSKILHKLDDSCYEEFEETSAPVSSFYVSIKRDVLNQYGSISSIEWIPTSNKVWELNETSKEFGGDTYIGRFADKRKHSFFTNTAYKLPDRLDIYYEDLNNIGYPIFFFNTKFTELLDAPSYELKILEGVTNAVALLRGLNNIDSPKTITNNTSVSNQENHGVQLGIADMFKQTIMNPYYLVRPGRYNVDCKIDNFATYLSDSVSIPTSAGWWKNTFGEGDVGRFIPNMKFDFSGVKGRIYTYNYAIPYFICESDVNLDYRYAENPNEKDFYPRQTNLDYWLQQENVDPKIPNYFLYNRSYSKQNKEEITLKNDANFFKEKDRIFYENRVIYSQDGAEVENSDFKDNYLYFKALDSFDFTYENGKLISVDSIESEQVLVRFENNTRIFNAFNTIKTDGLDLTLGSGSLFGLRPQEFSKTSLGYIGSQHTEMLNTPFGHITVDAKRGNVFNIATGGKSIDELTKDGMRNWFAENLPFKISQYYNVNIDNSYAGIGIALSYDNRYKRFFLTKLDYIPLNTNIKFENNKFTLFGEEISLKDKRYFCDASFTISYSFYTKSWTSFHSFTPNYYVDLVDVFYTGLNNKINSLWVHNLTNKSFQRYYTELQPFEIEAFTAPKLNYNILNSISYVLDVIRYHNEFDEAYVENEAAFNKAIVFNNSQNSGLLELVKSTNSVFEKLKYPIKEADRTKILFTNKENTYSFNQFKNIAHLNLPKFINSCNNVNKLLNLSALNYNKYKIDNDVIRGDKNFVRLINDVYEEYKFIFKGIITDNTQSIR